MTTHSAFDGADERLDDLKPFLGEDADFYPDDVEVERMLAEVNAKIDARSTITSIAAHSRITPMWKQVFASAAAVVLVLGTAYVGVQMGLIRIDSNSPMQTANVDPNVLLSEIDEYESELYALADRDVQVLLWQAVADDGSMSAQRLLGDLTDDEYEFLQANFDVGDLL